MSPPRIPIDSPLVGAVPDTVAARTLGVSATTIRRARYALGLPAVCVAPGTQGRKLGALTDDELRLSTEAIRELIAPVTVTYSAIHRARKARRIATWEGKHGLGERRRVAKVGVTAPVRPAPGATVDAPTPEPVRAVVAPCQPGATAEERALRMVARARAAGKPETWIAETFGAWL